MATIRKKRKEPVSVFQRDPGPWSRLLINWLATLAVIMVFGLVMLFSASYTTGYLRMGDSFHYIKQQALCMLIGLGCMFAMSYVDHRFLRRMVVPGYLIVLAMLAVTLAMAPLNGCRRWIRFGGFTLQSSEVAKFEMILLCSSLAAKAPQVEKLSPGKMVIMNFREWLHVRGWKQLVIPVLPLIPVIALLALEPHMSGIVLTVAVVGTILLLSGSGGILTWVGAGTAGLMLETLLSHVDSIPYLQDRLDGWTQDLSTTSYPRFRQNECTAIRTDLIILIGNKRRIFLKMKHRIVKLVCLIHIYRDTIILAFPVPRNLYIIPATGIKVGTVKIHRTLIGIPYPIEFPRAVQAHIIRRLFISSRLFNIGSVGVRPYIGMRSEFIQSYRILALPLRQRLFLSRSEGSSQCCHQD